MVWGRAGQAPLPGSVGDDVANKTSGVVGTGYSGIMGRLGLSYWGLAMPS